MASCSANGAFQQTLELLVADLSSFLAPDVLTLCVLTLHYITGEGSGAVLRQLHPAALAELIVMDKV